MLLVFLLFLLIFGVPLIAVVYFIMLYAAAVDQEDQFILAADGANPPTPPLPVEK